MIQAARDQAVINRGIRAAELTGIPSGMATQGGVTTQSAIQAGIKARQEAEDDVEILELLLERMIEEELLVQRGIELDLHKKDIGVRKEMIKQVIDFIIQVEKNQISEEDLRDFYNKNIGKYLLFMVHLQQVYISIIKMIKIIKDIVMLTKED